ncbi:MAG: hypothetical protein ACHQJ6_00155 [Candidatus Berkiellales bacterium]
MPEAAPSSVAPKPKSPPPVAPKPKSASPQESQKGQTTETNFGGFAPGFLTSTLRSRSVKPPEINEDAMELDEDSSEMKGTLEQEEESTSFQKGVLNRKRCCGCKMM